MKDVDGCRRAGNGPCALMSGWVQYCRMEEWLKPDEEDAEERPCKGI